MYRPVAYMEREGSNWIFILIVEAYIGYNDFIKAKLIIEKLNSMVRNDTFFCCAGRIELGLCNYKSTSKKQIYRATRVIKLPMWVIELFFLCY